MRFQNDLSGRTKNMKFNSALPISFYLRSFFMLSLHSSDESGVFTMKIQAVDNDVVGEAAYFYNITIKRYPKNQPVNKTTSSNNMTISNDPIIRPTFGTNYTNNVTITSGATVDPNLKKDKKSHSDTARIAGGVAGAVILLVLSVILYRFARKRQRSQSIKVR